MEWISMKDKRPTSNDGATGRYCGLLIVCDKDGNVGFTYWNSHLGMPDDDVAYWMPLPAPPEG